MNLLAALVVFLLAALPVQARSGCCSHHGGVCGCGCCDGTGLSATCAPYYPSCGGGAYYTAPVYVPPTPDNPITQATINTVQSTKKPYFTVTISWDSTLPVSIAMTKVAGSNPGPNTDTSSGSFQFVDVSAGRWYINLKAEVGGVWSTIRYWTVDVPTWVEPTQTPIPTPTATPPSEIETPETTITPSPQAQQSDLGTGLLLATGIGTIGFLALKGITKFLGR